jgi:hypothetical protein
MGPQLTHPGGARTRITRMRASSLTFTLAALALLSAKADALTFTGYARSLDTGELLYIESHAVSGAGSAQEKRVVLYRCSANSPPFARKLLDYGSARTAPAFDFDDARSGFAEGLTRDSRGLTVFARAGAQAEVRAESLDAAAELVADAGFDEFVRERWDSLERGTVSKVPFVVPSLRESVNFRVRKVDETHIGGDVASVIRLSLAGPLGWFVPDIDVSYRKHDRRLMRYRGTTNIRDAAGELLKAQIDFPDTGRDTGPVDLAALRALPLVKSCL